ncbi:hypothetical protein ABE237_03045 [Brevibacillus formosus]|uniref:Uncharacterized protein n=1 Tax=Brevibacillus formosus TaxID=54913 RepID=A0ABQ0TFA1_9BACL|nr:MULTISPECIES: hypothetical protein [Brevibacillus]MED1948504.1 hypothetical protein [Brevibacillus formosus]MED1958436.1 hypothetical protein [Brevibacillus formosus]MED2001007.1 hypothetical protein [Brevibacillus formosus]MED2083685.1 hypothetical protein [Brevibacillus formosus]GED60113.1 hypothetical protein BFO01nite_42450 [Brevibacillus formosus]
MIAKYIGEALLFVVGLPIFAYQTFEGIHALADFFAQVSDFTNFK